MSIRKKGRISGEPIADRYDDYSEYWGNPGPQILDPDTDLDLPPTNSHTNASVDYDWHGFTGTTRVKIGKLGTHATDGNRVRVLAVAPGGGSSSGYGGASGGEVKEEWMTVEEGQIIDVVIGAAPAAGTDGTYTQIGTVVAKGGSRSGADSGGTQSDQPGGGVNGAGGRRSATAAIGRGGHGSNYPGGNSNSANEGGGGAGAGGAGNGGNGAGTGGAGGVGDTSDLSGTTVTYGRGGGGWGSVAGGAPGSSGSAVAGNPATPPSANTGDGACGINSAGASGFGGIRVRRSA